MSLLLSGRNMVSLLISLEGWVKFGNKKIVKLVWKGDSRELVVFEVFWFYVKSWLIIKILLLSFYFNKLGNSLFSKFNEW